VNPEAWGDLFHVAVCGGAATGKEAFNLCSYQSKFLGGLLIGIGGYGWFREKAGLEGGKEAVHMAGVFGAEPFAIDYFAPSLLGLDEVALGTWFDGCEWDFDELHPLVVEADVGFLGSFTFGLPNVRFLELAEAAGLLEFSD